MTNSTPCMIVIAGVCGAGMTTVLRELQTMLDSNLYACHDIDEAGHPDNAGEEWLATQTDRWLDIAHKNAKRGRSTVVSGILFPTMIESSKKFIAAPRIKYCVLSVGSTELEERLSKRYSNQRRSQDILRISGMPHEKFIQMMVEMQSGYLTLFNRGGCDAAFFDTTQSSIDEAVRFVYRHINNIDSSVCSTEDLEFT